MSIIRQVIYPSLEAYKKVQAYAKANGVSVNELLLEALEHYTDIKLLTPDERAAGGHARAAKLTPERRREIAQKAIKARWEKTQKKK